MINVLRTLRKQQDEYILMKMYGQIEQNMKIYPQKLVNQPVLQTLNV